MWVIIFDTRIKDAGDPIELAQQYVLQGADELVFLGITATIEKRKTLVGLVRRIAYEINILFTVGGGINSVADVDELLQAGADKVSINSSAVKHPELITEISDKFGSQCVVVAIDTKREGDHWNVFVHGGKRGTGMKAVVWAKQAEERGAGNTNHWIYSIDIRPCELITTLDKSSLGLRKIKYYYDTVLVANSRDLRIQL